MYPATEAILPIPRWQRELRTALRMRAYDRYCREHPGASDEDLEGLDLDALVRCS